MSGCEVGQQKGFNGPNYQAPCSSQSNGSINESHGNKAPAGQKQTFPNLLHYDALAQKLRGNVPAKLCTCEALRDRKFLRSCGSRLLCGHNRWRGPRPIYRARLCASCAPTEFPLTLPRLLTGRDQCCHLTSWLPEARFYLDHCFWTNQYCIFFHYSLPEDYLRLTSRNIEPPGWDSRAEAVVERESSFLCFVFF